VLFRSLIPAVVEGLKARKESKKKLPAEANE
jgi:hypothetical protein